MPTFPAPTAATVPCARAYPCCVLSFDIGGTKIAGALVTYDAPDAPPRVSCEARIPTDAARGGADVLDRLCAFASKLLEEVRAAGETPCAIGVSAAGRVDAARGCIAYANEIMPGWTGQPVGERLAKTCGLPAFVLNDVQAHGLGEARWGAARGVSDCLVIAVGTGIACCIIADGRLVRGAQGFAGEVGSTMNPLASGSRADRTQGDLESVVAGSGIEARYAALAGSRESGGAISRRAEAGEEAAIQVIEQSGYALGCSLASWAEILDPAMAVISGSVANAGARWRDALKRGFDEHAYPTHTHLPIIAAELGGNAPLIGAAEFALDSCASSATQDAETRCDKGE